MRRTFLIVATSVALLASGAISPLATNAATRASQLAPAQIAKLTASDPKNSEYFGASVAVSGNTIVVGAYGCDASGTSAGCAYVFNVDANHTVTQQAVLTPSDPQAADEFGRAVAISEGVIVVGSDLHEVQSQTAAGKAYIYVRPANGWVSATQTSSITSPSPAASMHFGTAVAISADTIVISERGGVSAPGSVQVYEKPASGWADVQSGNAKTLTASDAHTSDLFGISVAIDGSTIVVGAYGAGATHAGQAYVFTKPAGGWTTTNASAILSAAGVPANTAFGYSVAVSGNEILVAAPNAGFAYLFSMPNGGWVSSQTPNAEFASPDIERFIETSALAVTMNNSTIVIGAYSAIVNGISEGAANVYYKGAGGWVSSSTPVVISSPASPASSAFGNALAIDNDRIVIGADLEANGGTSRGSAYVYGLAPAFSVAPSALDFGSVTETNSSSKTLNVTNTGSFPLTISAAAVTGTHADEYSLANNTCLTAIAVLATCSVDVVFTPTAAGTKSAAVSFTDNATDSPQSVSVSGVGVALAKQKAKKLKFPKHLKSNGWTTLLKLPVTTNAGQTAKVNARCFTKSSRTSAAATKRCKLSRKHHKLRVHTVGTPTRVRVVVIAPATTEFAALRTVKVIRTK